MLARVIERNRQILHAVPSWIDEEAYRNSRSGYGCPPRLRAVLDRPIDEHLTYTDVLAFAALHVGRPLRYLEIGVSVGKNLYVLAHALRDAELFGFDWEAINPTLAAQLEPVDASGPCRRFRCGGNRVTYVQGDVLAREDWRPLVGEKFQMIFSDALHQREAVLYEFERLRELDLIDPERFFMLWDDLDDDPTAPMSSAFWQIADEMRRGYDVEETSVFQMRANGWLGQHEHPHLIGIINNVGLTRAALP